MEERNREMTGAIYRRRKKKRKKERLEKGKKKKINTKRDGRNKRNEY